MITLEHVSKGFAGGSNAVRDLSLEIPTGQTCVLLGPSGCGKTTTLRMINRLTEPDGGRILVDGVDTQRVDPVQLRLKMGYVIQQTGLFPHMTVADNVATVPRLWDWLASTSCWSWSGYRRASTASATRISCPAASGSASVSRARSALTRPSS